MSPLFRRLSPGRRDTYHLVLQSMGIASRLVHRPGGWEIRVPAADRVRATAAVRRYLSENPPRRSPAYQAAPRLQVSYDGIWMAGILLAVYLNRPGTDPQVARTFGAWASRIADGELWRSATSLLIHGGHLHLVGNMAGMALFGSAVCGLAGGGAGVFLIVLSGVIGTWVNALLHPPDHLAVGASTAVFGAIGILVGRRVIQRAPRPSGRMRWLVPLGGGLALLAMLGTAPGVDILAHLFGLLCGMLIAVAYFRWRPQRLPAGGQAVLLAATLALLIASWLAAAR